MQREQRSSISRFRKYQHEGKWSPVAKPLHTAGTDPLSACQLWGTWWNGMPGKPSCASWWSRTRSMPDSCTRCYLSSRTEKKHYQSEEDSIQSTRWKCLLSIQQACWDGWGGSQRLAFKLTFRDTFIILTAACSVLFITPWQVRWIKGKYSIKNRKNNTLLCATGLASWRMNVF